MPDSVKGEKTRASSRTHVVESAVAPEVKTDRGDVPLPSQELDAPDGGLIAWLQVVGGYLIFMNTWGVVNAYGAFQTVYEMNILKSNSPSAIAWVGSIQGCVLLFVGMLSGPIFDKGHFRSMVLTGAFLTFFGMLMTSFCTKYYQIFLAQGICVGIGTGLVYIPCVAVIASYFKRRRALALGISASGSGTGGVIYPAILLQLEPMVGFGWATRAIALIILVTLIVALALFRRRIVPKERRKLLDLAAFREPSYTFFTAGLTLGFMGSYVPYYYISTYATAETGASAELALYLVPILNAASIPGRIVPNIAADRIGAINTITPCALVCGVLVFGWIGMHALGPLLAFALLYGFFAGTFVSVTNAALVNLTDDMRRVGTRMGQSFTCAGFGILIGTPAAGALIDVAKKSFVRMQVFSAVLLIASSAFFAAARIAKVGPAWNAWL